jgi:outer membrane murein-binding lipoprotein Lpp
VKPVRVAVAVVAAVLVVSSCTSDPSPTKVAQDMINTVESDPDVRECMLDVVDEYPLDQLGEDARSDNPDEAARAQTQLDEYEAALTACK